LSDIDLLTLKWNRLAQRASTSTMAIPASESAPGMWLTLAGDGLRRVLLEIGEGQPPSSSLGKGALTMEVGIFTIDGLERRCISLTCDHAFAKPFDYFIGALIVYLAELEPAAAVDATVRDLVELLGLGGLGERHRNLGDLGELFLIRTLMELNPLALKLWTGPAQGRHDIKDGARAIEVKAGLRPVHQVRITRLEQLDPPDGGELWLAVPVFEADPSGELSLGDLAREVDSRSPVGLHVEPESRSRLEVLASLEGGNRYSLFQLRLFRIGPDTPRLKESMLVGKPPAVTAVSYTLALEHLEPWEIDPTDHETVWGLFT